MGYAEPRVTRKGLGGLEFTFRFQGRDSRGLPLGHEIRVSPILARSQIQAFKTVKWLELKASDNPWRAIDLAISGVYDVNGLTVGNPDYRCSRMLAKRFSVQNGRFDAIKFEEKFPSSVVVHSAVSLGQIVSRRPSSSAFIGTIKTKTKYRLFLDMNTHGALSFVSAARSTVTRARPGNCTRNDQGWGHATDAAHE
jgi:hypothetical protein